MLTLDLKLNLNLASTLNPKPQPKPHPAGRRAGGRCRRWPGCGPGWPRSRGSAAAPPPCARSPAAPSRTSPACVENQTVAYMCGEAQLRHRKGSRLPVVCRIRFTGWTLRSMTCTHGKSIMNASQGRVRGRSMRRPQPNRRGRRRPRMAVKGVDRNTRRACLQQGNWLAEVGIGKAVRCSGTIAHLGAAVVVVLAPVRADDLRPVGARDDEGRHRRGVAVAAAVAGALVVGRLIPRRLLRDRVVVIRLRGASGSVIRRAQGVAPYGTLNDRHINRTRLSARPSLHRLSQGLQTSEA